MSTRDCRCHSCRKIVHDDWHQKISERVSALAKGQKPTYVAFYSVVKSTQARAICLWRRQCKKGMHVRVDHDVIAPKPVTQQSQLVRSWYG